MGTLKFWTTGEDMTKLIHDHIRSGSFYNAIEVLKEGGMDDAMILAFFRGYYKLDGDTRTEDGIQVVPCDEKNKYLVDGWISWCNSYSDSDGDLVEMDCWEFDTIKRRGKTCKHMTSLLDTIGLDNIIEIWWRDLLRVSHTGENSRIIEFTDPAPIDIIRDGIILRDGTFIEVAFESHRFLFPILDNLKQSNTNGDVWGHDEDMCIRISDFRVSGKVVKCMGSEYGRLINEGIEPTSAQVETMFKFREHFNTVFGSKDDTAVDIIRRWTVYKNECGSKYGNLAFLDKFYDVKIPEMSKTTLHGKYALRSSPNVSMAGVLETYFDVDSESHETYVEKMKALYEPYKDLRHKNELNWFSQRIVVGVNGVCHYYEKGNFNYQASNIRGAVVGGSNDTVGISNDSYDYLRSLSRDLYNDLGKQIQLEFVIDENDNVHILQLRTINTPKEDMKDDFSGYNKFAFGRSFCAGNIGIDLKDCIVVQNQIESKEIIGKKALIVRDMVDFSHALTLSEQLRIPSIFGIGDVELPERFGLYTRVESGFLYDLDSKE